MGSESPWFPLGVPLSSGGDTHDLDWANKDSLFLFATVISVLGTRPEQIKKKKGTAEFFLGLLGTGVHMALWPTESHLRISRGDPKDKADSKKRETEKRNQDPLVNVLNCIKIMPFGFSVSKTNTSFAAWARLFFFVWFGFLIVWLQTMVLKKTSESPLDSKGIKPINPTGNQPWIFIERTDDEAEAPKLLATWGEELIHWKRPWCWERLKAGGEGDDRGWDGWMASLTGHEFEQTPGGSEGQRSLVCCIPWGHRVRHDWQSEHHHQQNLYGCVGS